MDQEITTCPQCGATVQPPARFCVTCGIKLPDSIANHDESEPVDPRAGWSTTDVSGWTTPPPGAFDFEDPSIIDVETIPVTTEPPVSRWASWPSQPEKTEAEPEPVGEEPAIAVEDALVETTTPALEVVEMTTPDPDLDDSSESATIEPEAVLEAGSLPLDETTTEITPIPDEPAAVFTEVIEDIIDADEPVTFEAYEEAVNDFEPAGWDESEEVEEEALTQETAEAFLPVAEAEDVDSVLAEELDDSELQTAELSPSIERANALLDELRALLPTLALNSVSVATEPVDEPHASEPAAPTIDLAALRTAAVDSRGEISFDNFAALRATIDEATSKPRDVEVMLKLSQRVDDIVALIAERDRLQLAFDSMIERLDQ